MRTGSPFLSSSAPVSRDDLPDHASATDHRELELERVGISGLRYPISVWDRANREQHTVAELAAGVCLPKDAKGTHMSRFVEIINSVRHELSLGTIPNVLEEIQRRLEADDAYLTVSFPYFLRREAPVSGAASLMDYACRFEAARRGEELDFILGVKIPVTTLCPCSKAVSEYGAHNQRGIVDVEVRFDELVWIEQVVEAVEGCASAPLYALLKREDEKFVTEQAYDNPRFVEDLTRDVVLAVRQLEAVTWVRVTVENLESIHNHSAFATTTWPESQPGGMPGPSREPIDKALDFGPWLKEQRSVRGFSQQELARRIGVSASLLSRVESGSKTLAPDVVEQLSRVLGCDHDKLLVRTGQLEEQWLRLVRRDPEGFLDWARRRSDV